MPVKQLHDEQVNSAPAAVSSDHHNTSGQRRGNTATAEMGPRQTLLVRGCLYRGLVSLLLRQRHSEQV